MKSILLSMALIAPISFAQQEVEQPQPSAAQIEFEQTLKVQSLLDQHRFSVGEIDGVWGSNTERALKAFQYEKGLPMTGIADEATLQVLGTAETMTSYTITAEDADQPLRGSIPSTMLGMSKVGKLYYTSLAEALGEKLQVSPKLIEKLNPDVNLVEGTTLTVPVVAEPLTEKVRTVVVTQADSSVRLYAEGDRLLAFYPTTLGSPQSPPPFGELKISGVFKDPYYNYDPERFVSPGTDTKVTLKPGPNNPVGKVWIALSRKHYGIHGTPEPSKISKTSSNGCIRLTNWDALEVAAVVDKGITVIIQE